VFKLKRRTPFPHLREVTTLPRMKKSIKNMLSQGRRKKFPGGGEGNGKNKTEK